MGGGGLGWGGGLSRGVIELTSLQSAEIYQITTSLHLEQNHLENIRNPINEENYVKVNTILNRIVHVYSSSFLFVIIPMKTNFLTKRGQSELLLPKSFSDYQLCLCTG